MQTFRLNVLLDLALKSDEIVELIEYFDLSVVYDFDRLNEGTADRYWVSAYDAGFQLGFNDKQVLKTVFTYVAPRDGFSPVDPEIVNVPFYSSAGEAQRAISSAGVSYTTGGPGHHWIKAQLPEYAIHYEFNAQGDLTLVTLTASDA